MNLDHLEIGRPIPVDNLPKPTTFYEILQDFMENNNEELLLTIQKAKSKEAILCFVSKDIDCPDDDQRGFNFLLYDDDSIDLILDESDAVKLQDSGYKLPF